MAIGMVGEEEVECGSSHHHHHQCSTHEDLCTRTSWVDARIALSHINKGRATGSRGALWVRKILQDQLLQLGDFSDTHAGKILFVALLIMATFCVGLKSATLITDIEKLWVEEGGRLERELDYVSHTLGEGAGTTNQILIQTPREGFSENILTPSALTTHLRVLLAATNVTVDMFDITWRLNDLCLATSFPYFENHIIDQIFERLTPCTIITPLDCFWEGSKLLGPEFYVSIPGYGEKVKWSNLNPQKIVDKMKEIEDASSFFPFSTFGEFMKRSGITTAYQQKPCLNPEDPQCPATAPNKQSMKPPDIGAELTGGCYGFAGKFLHWPEELIVGGTKKNRTGHIIRGEALQSIVQLMGSKDLYEHWQDHYKVHNMEWSQEKAEIILGAWIKKFSQSVKDVTERLSEETRPYHMQPFASSALPDLIRQFSGVSVPRVVIGCVVMVLYACCSLARVGNPSESSAGLGFAGVALVVGSVASGLGLCALLGLPFTAATTQVLPFLALGLGVDDMFLMVTTVGEVDNAFANTHKGVRSSRVGEILKRCGVSVVMTSLCHAAAFFAAAVIPVPALRVLCLQAGLIILITLAAMLLVFPALISLDLRRRDARRLDLLCCLPLPQEEELELPSLTPPQNDISKRTAVTRALSPPGRGTVTQVLCGPSSPQECWVGVGSLQASSPSLESLTAESTGDLVCPKRPPPSRAWYQTVADCGGFTLRAWVRDVYASTLTQGSVKAASLLCLFLTVAASAWGVSRLRDGLDLTEVMPSDSPEAMFLQAQKRYFGFYNMFAVTQGNFEYPTKQKLLHEYHESFNRISWIIKNDDGGLPDSWLALFRDWLLGLQRAFDNDWSKGYITEEGWERNASERGVLAYKLLVQTGHVDHPVDRSLVSQVRLVDSEGIINPKAFYNYLTAWVTNDALAYSVSQVDLRPMPRFWYHERSDYDLKIPKSSPIVYAQLPFYLNRLDDTEVIVQMINEVRAICKKFEDKGLPNFPTGIPFTFWEQYIRLRFFLLLALSAVLGAVFLVLSVVLVNVWAAAIVVLILAALVLQLAGVMGLIGLKLSAAPAVLLVVSVGVGVEVCVHVTLGFLTAVGDRDRRVRLALSHIAAPVLNGALSTLLGATMLLCSDFDFVRRGFFVLAMALVFLGSLNGFLFLPVLLALVGPPAQLVSRTNPDRVPTPSPPPSPPPPPPNYSYPCGSGSTGVGSSRRPYYYHHSYHKHSPSSSPLHHPHHAPPPNAHAPHPRRPYHGGSNLSLTTITEEPASSGSTNSSRQSSHEILVEPQVVVETTTFGGSPKQGNAGGKESPEGSVIYHEGPHVTTTVTATAKVKVELHNKPLTGGPEGVHRTSGSSNIPQNSSSKRSSGHSRVNSNSPATNISVSSSRSGRSSSISSGNSCSTNSSVSDKHDEGC